MKTYATLLRSYHLFDLVKHTIMLYTIKDTKMLKILDCLVLL